MRRRSSVFAIMMEIEMKFGTWIAGCLAIAGAQAPAWADVAESIETGAPIGSAAAMSEARRSPMERLAELDAAQRANAVIDVELGERATPLDRELAVAAAALWNDGQAEQALAQIATLEDAGALVGIGVHWRAALLADDDATRAGLDPARRIGSPRTDAGRVALVEDRDSGFLFVVVAWDNGDWTLNRSVNGGLSWLEMYYWAGLNSAPGIDITVAGEYIYVGYDTGVALFDPDHVVRIRRFEQTGEIDATFSALTVFSGEADYVDVALVSSAEQFPGYENVYCMATDQDGYIHYAWDNALDGRTFETVPTGAGDAPNGIDLTFNAGPGDAFLYASFVDSLDRVHVLKREPGQWTNSIIDHDYLGFTRQTSISASNDTVVCAYESIVFGLYYTAKYEITHNGGLSWDPGTLAAELNQHYVRPDVTLSGGYGIGAAFIGDLPVGGDSLAFRSRPGMNGSWNYVQETAVNDTWILTNPSIDSIEPSFLKPSALYAYGMAYVADADKKPYFRRWDHCAGDTDGDNVIGLTDLAELLSRYGAADIEQGEASDVNGDGAVDISDLATMLSLFGTGCS